MVLLYGLIVQMAAVFAVMQLVALIWSCTAPRETRRQ